MFGLSVRPDAVSRERMDGLTSNLRQKVGHGQKLWPLFFGSNLHRSSKVKGHSGVKLLKLPDWPQTWGNDT